MLDAIVNYGINIANIDQFGRDSYSGDSGMFSMSPAI